jgi:prepilin-type N-terminal cleavage/methylation domain-containing protein
MRPRATAGFTLVEVLVALLLLSLALAIAVQLLMETQQMLVDAARESLDPAAAVIATRLRADVLGATVAIAAHRPDLSCNYLELAGHPPGPIFYQLAGGSLVRSVTAANGTPLGSTVLLRGATSFSCFTSSAGGVEVVLLEYHYRRSRTRRSPLPSLPGQWGPRWEVVGESLVLTPRGGGLGSSW